MHPHLFPWFLPIIQISLNGSIWSTVSVTVERCLNGMSHIFDHFIVPITPLRTVCQLNNLTSALHISEIELCFPMLSDIGNLLSLLSFRYISVVHPRHCLDALFLQRHLHCSRPCSLHSLECAQVIALKIKIFLKSLFLFESTLILNSSTSCKYRNTSKLFLSLSLECAQAISFL